MRKGDNKLRVLNRAVNSGVRGLVPSKFKGLRHRPMLQRIDVSRKPLSDRGSKSLRRATDSIIGALSLLLVLSLTMAVITAPAVADTSNTYSERWTSQDPLDSGVGDYIGLVMDSNGDVYVAKMDSQNVDKTIGKFDSNDGGEIWSLTVQDLKDVNSNIDHVGGGEGIDSQNEYEVLTRDGEGHIITVANNASDGSNDILIMIDESTGNVLDTQAIGFSFTGSAQGSSLHADGNWLAVVETDVTGDNYKIYNTSGDQFQLEFATSVGAGTTTKVRIDSNKDVYFANPSDNAGGIKKRDYDLSNQKYAIQNVVSSAVQSIVLNGTGQGTDSFLASTNGELGKVSAASDDTSASKAWEVTLTSLDTDLYATGYDDDVVVVGAGGGDGLLYIRNSSDGSSVDLIDLGDASDVSGVGMDNGQAAAVQHDGTVVYYVLPSAPATPTPTPTASPTPGPTPTPTPTFGPSTPPPGGEGYSDFSWSNWDNLSPGEKAILIFTDFSILYLLAITIISTGVVRFTGAPKLGLGVLFLLTAIGWIGGYLPDFVALTLLIFYVFFGYAGEQMLSN